MVRILLSRLFIIISSVAITLFLSEALLRFVLFHTKWKVPIVKDAAFYANDEDEYWIYQGIFATPNKVYDGEQIVTGSPNFYDNWGTSLTFDPQLGYVPLIHNSDTYESLLYEFHVTKVQTLALVV